MTNIKITIEHDTNNLGCIRCGKCCEYIMYKTNGEPYLKRCKHLVRLKTGKTICRMYYKRKLLRTGHGIKVDEFMIGDERKDVFCLWRINGHFDYEGCPFNTDKPLFEEYCAQVLNKNKKEELIENGSIQV